MLSPSIFEAASWQSKDGKRLILVKVKPSSKKTAILGLVEVNSKYPVKKALSISLNAKAEDNKANIELIELIAETEHIPKSKIHIKYGLQSRLKLLELN